MQIDYQLTLEDIAAFSLHHTRTSRRSRRRLWFSQALGIFSALVFVIIWPEWSTVERAIFFIALFLFWLIAYPGYYRWAIKRNMRKIYSEAESKGALGEHTIIIKDEGVIERSGVGESRTAWNGIEKIDDDDRYIYLYTGPLTAHVIPKRAFSTDDDMKMFLQSAQAYRSRSRGQQALAADSP